MANEILQILDFRIEIIDFDKKMNPMSTFFDARPTHLLIKNDDFKKKAKNLWYFVQKEDQEFVVFCSSSTRESQAHFLIKICHFNKNTMVFELKKTRFKKNEVAWPPFHLQEEEGGLTIAWPPFHLQ